MRISIALATFNGEPHLRRQLESIAAQSRLPDELIVCDDLSGDNTPRIIQECASSAPFVVRAYGNDKRLGVRRNFEKAISLCNGDLIALCDQDDVWNCNKLEAVETEFSSSKVGLVFSDAELVEADLTPESRTLWQAVGFDSKKQRRAARGEILEVLLRANVITGATMVFRSRFRDLVVPIPAQGCLFHDGWIALIIAAVADIRFINKPLIKYRQHEAQLVGAPPRASNQSVIGIRKTDPLHYLEQATRFQQVYDRLAAHETILQDRRVLSTLREKIVHLRTRGNMPGHRISRLPVILSETLNRHYHKYSNGWFSAAKDLLV
jgi:glycosyltransferase involved in cell wall biosynthesis